MGRCRKEFIKEIASKPVLDIAYYKSCLVSEYLLPKYKEIARQRLAELESKQ